MVHSRLQVVRFGTLAVAVTIALMFAALVSGIASGQASDPKVTLCHRTNSVTNPYNLQTVAESALNDPPNANSDHLHHGGDPFDFTADPDVKYPPPRNGEQWGDIVPPFDENGNPRPDTSLVLNWPSGQAIFEAGCGRPTTTTTGPGGTTPTTGPGGTTPTTGPGGTTPTTGPGGTTPTTGGSGTPGGQQVSPQAAQAVTAQPATAG